MNGSFFANGVGVYRLASRRACHISAILTTVRTMLISERHWHYRTPVTGFYSAQRKVTGMVCGVSGVNENSNYRTTASCTGLFVSTSNELL